MLYAPSLGGLDSMMQILVEKLHPAGLKCSTDKTKPLTIYNVDRFLFIEMGDRMFELVHDLPLTNV
jgi:hypothetical protein